MGKTVAKVTWSGKVKKNKNRNQYKQNNNTQAIPYNLLTYKNKIINK